MSRKKFALAKLLSSPLVQRTGFALTEALIAGGIGIAVVYSVSEGMVHLSRSSKITQSKSDWNATTSVIRQIMSDPFACTRALQNVTVSNTCNATTGSSPCVVIDLNTTTDKSINTWSSPSNRTPILTLASPVSGISATSIQFQKLAAFQNQINKDYNNCSGGCQNRDKPSGSIALYRSDATLVVNARIQTAPNIFTPLNGLGTSPANTFPVSIYYPAANIAHQSASGTAQINANSIEFCTPQNFNLNTLLSSYPLPAGYVTPTPLPAWNWAPVRGNNCDNVTSLSVGCLLANAHVNDLPYSIAAPNLITSGGTGAGSSFWQNPSATNDIYYSAGNVGIGTSDPASSIHVSSTLRASQASTNPIAAQIIAETPAHRLYLGSYYTAGLTEFSAIQSSAFWGSPPDHPASLSLNPIGGNVGIGTTNPTYPLDVSGGSNYSYYTTGRFPTLVTTPVSIRTTGALLSSSFLTSSDRRLKEKIKEISLETSLNFLRKVQPVHYRIKNSGEQQYGFIAQNIIKSGYPEFIGIVKQDGLNKTVDEDGFESPKDTQFTLNYGNITSILTRSAQHFLVMISTHDERLQKLEAENKTLKAYLCAKDSTAPFCESKKQRQ